MKAIDNFAQFETQLVAASRSVETKAADVKALVAVEILERLVALSPVKTGRFKNNWRVALNQPEFAALDGVDKTGERTLRRGKAKIAQARLEDDIWITNNVNYALYLEEGTEFMEPRWILRRVIDLMDGWSKDIIS